MTHIALLRGINVGGHKMIKMANLKKHFESFGATNVRTYIQSGNVVFEHKESKSAKLRAPLEKHLAAELGYAVPTLVVSARELDAIAKSNPYDATLPELGKRMYVCFFEKTPPAAALESLAPYITPAEQFILTDLAGFAYYADGLGRAKLSSALIERKLGLVTFRNWNTVNALLALANP